MEKIRQSLMELLKTKELNRITVSEICEKAGLNRSTFYANFLDVYDLADTVRTYLEEEIQRLYQDERMQGFNSNDYLKLFRHIREHAVLYKIYFKLGYDHTYQIRLYDTGAALRYFDGRQVEYPIEFFRCGLNAVIKKWLENDCRETPEEMTEILESEYQGRTP